MYETMNAESPMLKRWSIILSLQAVQSSKTITGFTIIRESEWVDKEEGSQNGLMYNTGIYATTTVYVYSKTTATTPR